MLVLLLLLWQCSQYLGLILKGVWGRFWKGPVKSSREGGVKLEGRDQLRNQF